MRPLAILMFACYVGKFDDEGKLLGWVEALGVTSIFTGTVLSNLCGICTRIICGHGTASYL